MNANLQEIIRAGAIVAAVLSTSACNQAEPSPRSSDVPAPISSAPTSSPAVLATPQPSITPALPSAAVLATFATDAFIATISPDVRVRSRPEVSDASKKLTPLLPIATRLFVVSGPIRSSGFDWYLVAPRKLGLPSGWVAAGHPADPWLAPATVECPTAPSKPSRLGQLLAGDALLALSCFGGRKFTFDALLGSYEAQCGVEPCCDVLDTRGCILDGWLIDPSTTFVDSALQIVFDGIDQSKLPTFTFDQPIRVRATGQLDHPFARGCQPDPHGFQPDLIRELGVLGCRTRFVVSSVVPR